MHIKLIRIPYGRRVTSKLFKYKTKELLSLQTVLFNYFQPNIEQYSVVYNWPQAYLMHTIKCPTQCFRNLLFTLCEVLFQENDSLTLRNKCSIQDDQELNVCTANDQTLQRPLALQAICSKSKVPILVSLTLRLCQSTYSRCFDMKPIPFSHNIF